MAEINAVLSFPTHFTWWKCELWKFRLNICATSTSTSISHTHFEWKEANTKRKTTAKQLHYHSQSPFLIDIRIIMFVKRIWCDISPFLVVHFLPHSALPVNIPLLVIKLFFVIRLFFCLFVLYILLVHFHFTPILFLFF